MKQFEAIEADLLGKSRRLENTCLSPIIKTPQELMQGSPLLWDMTEDVIIVFDRNDFLKQLLDDVKQRLRLLGAVRVRRANAWYWILKKDFVPDEIFEV